MAINFTKLSQSALNQNASWDALVDIPSINDIVSGGILSVSQYSNRQKQYATSSGAVDLDWTNTDNVNSGQVSVNRSGDVLVFASLCWSPPSYVSGDPDKDYTFQLLVNGSTTGYVVSRKARRPTVTLSTTIYLEEQVHYAQKITLTSTSNTITLRVTSPTSHDFYTGTGLIMIIG